MTSSANNPAKEGTGPAYFWREHEEEPYGFMSQWYESPFYVDGVKYLTAEMWMMVQKAKLFGDEDIAKKMLATESPKQHKALGRKVKDFTQEKWESNRSRIVEEGNWHKFTVSKDAERLHQLLLETGDRELVEDLFVDRFGVQKKKASPRDAIWGIGFSEKTADARRDEWGLNLLGKALMEVRRKLREQDEE